jgi:hypothetical protein
MQRQNKKLNQNYYFHQNLISHWYKYVMIWWSLLYMPVLLAWHSDITKPCNNKHMSVHQRIPLFIYNIYHFRVGKRYVFIICIFKNCNILSCPPFFFLCPSGTSIFGRVHLRKDIPRPHSSVFPDFLLHLNKSKLWQVMFGYFDVT